MRLRLSTRLILAVVTIQALVLIALVWNSVRLINTSHINLLEESIRSETKLLANSLAPGLAVNDRAILEDVLALLNDKKTLVYIIVFNDHGDVMAGYGRPHEGAPDMNYQQALLDGVYDVASSIELEGQTLGSVNIGYSLQTVSQIVHETRNQNTAIGLLGLALSIIVTIASSLFITRNLRYLEESAYALKRGELNYRIQVTSRDEIADVANALNSLATHLDTTQQQLKLNNISLERETRHLETLLNGINAVVIEAKTPGYQFNYVSQEAENLLGYKINEWLQPNFWQKCVYPEDIPWLKKTIKDNSNAPGSFTVDFRMIHKLGHMLWVRAINNVEIDGEGHSTIRGLLLDIMEQKTAEDRIIYLAEHDSLTGLINRRRFQDELERSIAYTQRYQKQGALLFIDLDEFKYINDTYGHQYGDEYLLDVSRRLARALRRTDILGRLGGDEFGVIIPSASTEEAETVVNSLLATLSHETIAREDKLIHISASIGIAFFPTQSNIASDLLAKADAAMYTAKNKGRGQYHIYSDDDGELWSMQEKIHWEERIRDALEQELFVLYFQPVANLNTHQIVHYEVLLRMLGNNGELIGPGSFIDTAERFGLIRDIDRWVIRHAIKALGERHQAGEQVTLAVNISGRHFGTTEILLLVKESMKTYGADPSNIIFEVTETAAVENLTQARSFIESLKNLGCRFALDDFGIGFSSFHYLRNLPVDFVKIDGSFVRNLHIDKEDKVFVKAMVDLASGLGMTCIAECVENADIVAVLQELGVQYGQGYHLARPNDDTLRQPRLKFA